MSCRWMLALALLPACYAPRDPVIVGDDETGEDSDSSGGGSSGAMSTSTASSTDPGSSEASTTPSDSSTGESGETSAGDAPPELSSFSVNGSEMPSEILEAEIIEIQVAADDDVGIDRVEFYDGDTLLASFTEPPYRTELLATSADNGGHSYTAVAYDTAGQTAEAGPIPLSVSIDGGAVVAEQDQIFRGRFSIASGAPAIVEAGDDIVLCGGERFQGAGFTTSRMRLAHYSSGLSQLALAHHPASPAASPVWTPLGAPAVSTDNGTAFVVSFTSGELETHLHAVDLVAETWEEQQAFDASGGAPVGALGRAPDGTLFMASSETELAKLTPSGGMVTWEMDATTGLGTNPTIAGVSSDAEGNALLDVFHSSGEQSLRKISPDGDILWTRAQPGLGLMSSAAGPQDRVASVVALDGDAGLSLVVRDATGAELESVELFDGREFAAIFGVRYDVTGRVVAVGIENVSATDTPYYEGWAGRLDEDGTVIWEVNLDFGPGDDRATGIATTASGRLYVTGYANPSSPAPFVAEGDVWLVELAL